MLLLIYLFLSFLVLLILVFKRFFFGLVVKALALIMEIKLDCGGVLGSFKPITALHFVFIINCKNRSERCDWKRFGRECTENDR